MNRIATEIKNYWLDQNQYFRLDSETLETVVDSLSEDDKLILGKGKEVCFKDPTDKEMYLFAVNKAFNRHNDIIAGNTVIENGEVICSEKSSITELDISAETLWHCNRHCIYHVEDIEKDILPTLSFEAIADLTAAIISYNAIHSINTES